MCGRFDLHDLELIPDRYGVELPDNLESHYNTAPTQKSPVVLESQAQMMSFGIIPFWAKTPMPIINARAETVQEKRTFQKPFAEQRCLVPVNGFFEWTRADGKQPYYFTVKGEDIFSLAGIWDSWDKDGQTITGFTILTTDANDEMKQIHDRMPVILDRDEEAQWVNPDLAVEQAYNLLDPFQGKLDLWPVSKKVNKPQNDTADVISKLPAT